MYTRPSVFLWAGSVLHKVFTSQADFANGSGDLIEGAGGKEYWCAAAVSWALRQERGNKGGGFITSLLSEGEGRRESVESPCNTWGPFLKLQETKEMFRVGKNEC